MLPVLYHHFGCVCSSFEALSVVAQLVTLTGAEGVLDMASGNGHWTFLLRRIEVSVDAVNNLEAVWMAMWVGDTVKGDGVEYLRRRGGARDRVLLMVYMVPRRDFTKQALKAYKEDTVVVAGTQNDNRFTGYSGYDCRGVF
jgi:hypothetical protein